MKRPVLSSEAMPLFTAASSSRESPISDVGALGPAAMGSAPHSDDEQSLADVEGEPCELLDDVDEDQAELSVQAHSPERAVRIKGVVVDHHTFVWRSLVRLGVPRADAEDALQQVFMVTARRIDDIAPGSERSFLYGVCLRVASRARRTVARRREVVGEDACPERVDTAARPDEMLDRARARALLDDILTTMPIELRAVFTLFELEQLTMSEIATLIGVPQGTVASRLRRARELFAEQRKRIEARMRSARSATIDRAAAPTARIGLTEGEGT